MGQAGTIFRGPDGSLYLIPDDILERCRVRGQDLERLNQMLPESAAEVEGFLLHVDTGGGFTGAAGYAEGDALTRSEPPADR